jgi:hypothetical protein
MKYTLYVDLKGDDREHLEQMESTVCDTLKGMGLAWRSEEQKQAGVWPPMISHFRVTEGGEVVRLAFDWKHPEQAKEAGRILTEWLTANMWVESGVLLNVFVLDAQTLAQEEVILGEALGFINLYKSVTAEV